MRQAAWQPLHSQYEVLITQNRKLALLQHMHELLPICCKDGTVPRGVRGANVVNLLKAREIVGTVHIEASPC